MATATLGQVEPFDLQNDDWKEYTERLEQFFAANGIMDQVKKVTVFLTVLGGKAYALLRNLLASMKPAASISEPSQGHEKPFEAKATHNCRKIQVSSSKSARGRDCSPVVSH